MAAIIFDFDGTIADTIDYFLDFIAKEAGLNPLTKEERVKLYGMPLVSACRVMGVSWYRMPRLYFKGLRLMGPKMGKFKPFKGVPKVIKKLHAEGHELFIITSNSVENVRKFLKRQSLRTSFLQVYGGVLIFSKASALSSLLKEQNIEVKDAIYIGDELRDVLAAQAIGMRVVAVGWGFARVAELEAQKPTAIAKTPDELMSILENI